VAELDHGLKEIAFITAQVHDARKLRAAQQDEALDRMMTWSVAQVPHLLDR
jgi:hypothetical protein